MLLLDAAEVVASGRTSLTGYKSPTRVVVVPTVGRAPNDKVDHKRGKADAPALVGG